MEHTCIASKSKKNKSSLTQNTVAEERTIYRERIHSLGTEFNWNRLSCEKNHSGDDFSPAVTVTRRMIKIMQHRKHRQEPGSN